MNKIDEKIEDSLDQIRILNIRINNLENDLRNHMQLSNEINAQLLLMLAEAKTIEANN